MVREISYTRVLSSNSSYQLVRTNPKLTGNLKLTINETGRMWLDSIKANLELAKEDYSRFPIDTTQSLASNIYQFFKNGETPNEIIFGLTETVDTSKTSKDFKDQYDFSNYFSGIKYFPSNKYEERLSYFAPIYLKRDLPDYFVVFKINDPINAKIDLSKQNYDTGQTRDQYLIDLFKKATIIKTFDLRANSTPGQFIRSYLNSSNFPISPLTVSFEEDEFTTWNGIIVNAGTLGSRGELLYDQYRQSTPLKFFEENITKGFERNGIIFPNILNLEFIFNDDSSKNYEINRYLGLYLNSIELSKIDIDLDRAYGERKIWPNTPRFRTPYQESDETTVLQSNSSGVIVPFKNMNFNLSEFNEIFTDSETLYFNYLTDKDDRFYLPKLDDPYDVSLSVEIGAAFSAVGTLVTVTTFRAHEYETDDLIHVFAADSQYSGSYFITKTSATQFTYSLSSAPASLATTGDVQKEIGVGKITLSNTQIDLGRFFGPSNDIYLQDTGFASALPGYSYTVFRVSSDLNHGDEVRIYHPSGTRLDSNGAFDLFTGVSNYVLTPEPGDYYVFNDYDDVTGFDVFYFSIDGNTINTASALAGALNGVQNKTFAAYAFNEYVFIICTVPGDFDSQHKISFFSPIGDYSTCSIELASGSALIGSIFDFQGGNKVDGNRLVIDAGHLSKINQEFDNLLVKTGKGWSKIKKVSKYIDLINEANQVSNSLRLNSIEEYLNNIVIILEDDEIPTISYSQFLIRKKFRPSFGLLSMFPIRDLDFDFYSSQYLNFPSIDLYQYYFIPADAFLIEPGKKYRVINGTVLVDDGTTQQQYSDTVPFFTVAALSKYRIAAGDPIVALYDDSTVNGGSLVSPIYDKNKELQDFIGFSILKDPSKVIPQENTQVYELKTKYLNGLTSTEYDYYKENNSSDFAVRSKILPYINKWAIKDGFDSRDNPYRLNTELVFGRNNFSPDHQDRTQNPNNFTHEWFYIESKFNYALSESTMKENDYYFNTPLNVTQLLNDPNYFLEYFTYTPGLGTNNYGEPIDLAPTQFRYSSVFKNVAGQYETFFKGFKLSFKDVTDPAIVGEDGKPVAKVISSRFDEYKFSCILKPVPEDISDQTQPPIRYRVIEHTDHKYIVLVIEVAIGYITQNNPYWSSLDTATGIYSIGNNPTAAPYLSPGAGEVYFADPTVALFGLDLPYQTINGDYRISFDANLVSNLNYSLLYSLKHKKFNQTLNNFSNVKLSSKLNLTISGINGTSIERFQNQFIPNYPSILSDEITIPSDKTFIVVNDPVAGFEFFVDGGNSFNLPVNTNPIFQANDEFANFSIISPAVSIRDTRTINLPPYTFSNLNIPLAASYIFFIRDTYRFYVMMGGEQYFEKLIEKLSFSKFKQYVNSLDPFIEYESYSLVNGVTTLNVNPNFYLEIQEPSEISKINQLITNVDDDRPTQYAFDQIIGYTYEQSALNNAVLLNRYKGEYEPIAKELLHCRSNFKFVKNQIGDLNLSNTKLNSYVLDLLTLNNFNHIKIADTKILTLESDPAYSPVYPTVDEVAIGRADYFLLSSNWDWGFHQKYFNKSSYDKVSGALRVEEDESFLGKILIVPPTIELEQFSITTLTGRARLEDVDLDQVELVVKENQRTVDGFININNVLTSYFITDGIEQKFNEFLVNSNQYIGNFNSIQDYVKEYIRLNTLKLYNVDQVEFYSKRNTSLVSTESVQNSNLIQFFFLNDQQRFTQGYSLLRSVKINKPDRLIISFSIQKPVDSGLSISPKIKINFI